MLSCWRPVVGYSRIELLCVVSRPVEWRERQARDGQKRNLAGLGIGPDDLARSCQNRCGINDTVAIGVKNLLRNAVGVESGEDARVGDREEQVSEATVLDVLRTEAQTGKSQIRTR